NGNEGDDFFVVIRTSSTISGSMDKPSVDNRVMFTVRISYVTAGGENYTPDPNPATNTIICEAQIVDLITNREDREFGGYAGEPGNIYQTSTITYIERGCAPSGGKGIQPEIMPMHTYWRILGLNLAGGSGYTAGELDEYLTHLVAQLSGDHDMAGWTIIPLRGDPEDVSIWEDTNENDKFDPDRHVYGRGAYPRPLGDKYVARMGLPGEVNTPSTYGIFDLTDSRQKVKIPRVADGKVDFFIAYTTGPGLHGLMSNTPKYGSEVSASVDPGDYDYAKQPGIDPPIIAGTID
ncbi:unnamed protein product, partial [marine sediment metagenome]